MCRHPTEGQETRMHSKFLLFLIISLLLFNVLAARCSHSRAPAPFWLKEGAYAYYYFNFTVISFVNGTAVWNGNSTYGWVCVGLTVNTAMFEVSVNITGKRQGSFEPIPAPYAFEGKYTVSIDIETREAACGDTYLGFLPYWMTTDVQNLPYINESRLPNWVPKLGWQVIENFSSCENLTAYGLVGGVNATWKTPYKDFKGDELRSVLAVYNSTLAFPYVYEKDSGLWISEGTDNFWQQILETRNLIDPVLLDTNIHSLPEQPSLLTILLPYIVAIVIIVAAAATIYFVKIRKNKQATHKPKTSLQPHSHTVPRRPLSQPHSLE